MDLNEKIICQSCGMPMKREEDFGTNQDNSKSREYCRFCFQKGRFTDEGISLKDKIEKLVKISVNQLGMVESQARAMAQAKLPNLNRWREKK